MVINPPLISVSDFAGSQQENKITNKGNPDIDIVYSPRSCKNAFFLRGSEGNPT